MKIYANSSIATADINTLKASTLKQHTIDHAFSSNMTKPVY